MTSVDDLFKNSSLPNKRKLDPVRDPNEIYKSARLGSNGHNSRHARAEDEQAEDDDTEAGPAPPPPDEDEDGDYGPAAPPPEDDADDEDGRFFGSGMTKAQTDVMDFVDSQDPSAAAAGTGTSAKIDASWLRKTALNFEKTISKNAELRARFESDPPKFISSEADLDAAIKALSLLSDHPDLWPDFARLGCAASLVGLLAHENTDIAVGAVEIIAELTGEDVEAADDQWDAMVDAMLDADLLGLLVSNLGRLDEDADESDREGVYHALEVVENVLSRESAAERVAANDALLKWLLARTQRDEKKTRGAAPVTQNKQYAAELLSIIAQASPAGRRRLAADDLDAVDACLQLVAAYRKRDPGEKGGDEEEYIRNLFDALVSLADAPEGKAKFVGAEGVELCLIMLREGKMSKLLALRLLDHAVSPGSGGDDMPAAAADVCLKLVEAGGLKTCFTLLMKTTKATQQQKQKQKQNHGQQRDDAQAAVHLVAILASLLRLLPADSPERIRALAKFVEKGYEKTERLVALRRAYAAAVRTEEERIAGERGRLGDGDVGPENENAWFVRRLDAGLWNLQTVDVVLAWLVAEDGGARKAIRGFLGERDEGLEDVAATLREHLGQLRGEGENEESKDLRDMLGALLEALR